MMQKYKTRNSPRRANAITQAIAYLSDSCGWYGYFHYSDRLGELIWSIRFKADKYDVLNRLCAGHRNKIVTFARGDIRHCIDLFKLMALLTIAIIAILELTSLFVPIALRESFIY